MSTSSMACEPANYADWQQQRGLYADIVDEALASYAQWMAEDDYDFAKALHRIMDRMRERADAIAADTPAA
jgi:hypothetical protein